MLEQTPSILEHREDFFKVISSFVANECMDTGKNSISFMLCQIESIVKFFECIGHANITRVFDAICNHYTITFLRSKAWRICSISGIPNKETLRINEQVHVSLQYEKWVKCVWLVTHMLALERSRRHERYAVKTIAKKDADVYRRALLYVFQSFLRMYKTLQRR